MEKPERCLRRTISEGDKPKTIDFRMATLLTYFKREFTYYCVRQRDQEQKSCQQELIVDQHNNVIMACLTPSANDTQLILHHRNVSPLLLLTNRARFGTVMSMARSPVPFFIENKD